MKALRTAVLILIVSVVSCLSVWRPGPVSLPEAAAAGATNGVLVLVEGAAKRQPSGKGAWGLCHQGERVSAGDRLATEADSRLELKFEDGSLLRLDEESQVDLQPQGAVAKVKLWFGNVWASITKSTGSGAKFEVETPTAVAAVRGTEFRVGVTGEDTPELEAGTEVAVYDGEVEVVDLAGELEAIEEDPATYKARLQEYAVRLKANQQINIGRRKLMQRQFTAETQKVGVLPFTAKVRSVSNGVGMLIAGRFSSALQRLSKGRFEVVPPQTMQSKAAVLAASSREVRHVEVLRKLAAETGVTVVVVGVVLELPAERVPPGAVSVPADRRAFPLKPEYLRRQAPPRGGTGPGALGRGVGARQRAAAGGRAAALPPGVLVVQLRAIHLESGQTLFSRTLKFGAGADKSTLERELDSLGDKLSKSLPRVGIVVSVQGDQVVLRMKSGAPPVGERLLVLKRNDFVVHPETGQKLAPRLAGALSVERVAGTRVEARVVSTQRGTAPAVGDLAVPALVQQRKPLKPTTLDAKREAAREWIKWNLARRSKR